MKKPEPSEETGRERSDLWFQALLDNAVKTIDPWFNEAGFHFNYARHRSSMLDAGPRIGETFLLNTRLQRHDRETPASVSHYFNDTSMTMLSLNGLESPDALAIIDLPPSIELSLRLSHCFKRRRSRRVYTADPMPLAALATLLRAAAGITGHGKASLHQSELGGVTLRFRSAPSPGGLYGIELYAVVQHVKGLEPGLYLYHPRSDKLLLRKTQKGDGVVDKVRAACAYPEELITHSRAGAVFLLAGRPFKLMRKYGDRGLRYLFVEIGEMTQNIHLACTALGFGSVESAGFYDDDLNDAIGLDGGTATVLHTVLTGLPAEA
jgi:SagB-type dehydrogenase family enzyme